jgi:hypothetical protein
MMPGCGRPGCRRNDRKRRQVFAVKEQRIEYEEDQRSLAGVGRVLDQVERCLTIGEHPAEFAIQVSVLGR